jgi:hypothetical protein
MAGVIAAAIIVRLAKAVKNTATIFLWFMAVLLGIYSFHCILLTENYSALHGNTIPFAGSFAVFDDCCLDQIPVCQNDWVTG